MKINGFKLIFIGFLLFSTSCGSKSDLKVENRTFSTKTFAEVGYTGSGYVVTVSFQVSNFTLDVNNNCYISIDVKVIDPNGNDIPDLTAMNFKSVQKMFPAGEPLLISENIERGIPADRGWGNYNIVISVIDVVAEKKLEFNNAINLQPY